MHSLMKHAREWRQHAATKERWRMAQNLKVCSGMRLSAQRFVLLFGNSSKHYRRAVLQIAASILNTALTNQ